MDRYHFEDVSLVVVDANRDIRSSIRASLRLEGFGEVRDTHKVARAKEWVEESPPDLLVADAHFFESESESCGLFREIRHQVLGANPFIPMIAVAAAGLPPQMRKVIDSGVDHIVVKPVTISELLDRIQALVEKRKPFVVTCDYIGPDRRKEPRPGELAPLIEVPNSLRAKATRGPQLMSLREDIRAAAAGINSRKMERDAFQIAWLAARIADGDPARRRAHLTRLLEICGDLARRLDGSHMDHVSELCRSLTQVADKMLRAQSPDGRDMKILRHSAAAIHAAFPDGGDSAGIARDIASSVSRFAAH